MICILGNALINGTYGVESISDSLRFTDKWIVTLVILMISMNWIYSYVSQPIYLALLMFLSFMVLLWCFLASRRVIGCVDRFYPSLSSTWGWYCNWVCFPQNFFFYHQPWVVAIDYQVFWIQLLGKSMVDIVLGASQLMLLLMKCCSFVNELKTSIEL